MNINEALKAFDQGRKELKGDVITLANLMANAYETGFKTCWKILTGFDFDTMIGENIQDKKGGEE